MIQPARPRADAGSGDDLDFEAFFEAVYPPLSRALFLLTNDAAEAEDLAQEALARAFERWERVRRMDSPQGYVYRTALNLNRNRLRHLRMRARRALHVGAGVHPAEPEGVAESRDEVRRALAALSVEQRDALILVDWLGLDAEEAGRVLRIEAASVRGRLHRARTTLRERFGGGDG
jgi:RNA polymerase sigma factor (sigma-70 family)